MTSQARNSCPVCGSQQKKHLYTQKFSQISGQVQLSGYDIVLCKRCGVAYASSIPDQGWFDAYYRETSKYTNDQRDGGESPEDTRRFQEIVSAVAKHLPERDRRILDFGCATGGLLGHLKRAGYSQLLGVDGSPTAAEIARRLLDVRVVNCGLEEIARQEQPFDLLVQVGVLEHICDLRSALAGMRCVLRSGGLMYVEVPDAAGFGNTIGAPFQQFSIEHINFFSRGSLIGVMVRNGFEPVEVITAIRGFTLDSRMPVVCGVFRLAESNSPDPIHSSLFDEETEAALLDYISRSTLIEARIRQIIDDLVVSQQQILIWGAGTHTLHLMETTSFSKMNAVAFVDSNTHYQAKSLQGKPVLSPSAVTGHPQAILISSQVFQSEIENQIRHQLRLPNEVIKLYDSVALTN